MLIKPVNRQFSGKKCRFVHIISLTKSAVYDIIRTISSSGKGGKAMNRAEAILKRAEASLGTTADKAEAHALHNALGEAVTAEILPRWNSCRQAHLANRRACYFSMEFLMGRAVY